MTVEHPSFEQIGDLADGLLSPEDVLAVEGHVAACPNCGETLAQLRRLLVRARSLPARAEPPARAWPSIRDRLAVPAPGMWPRWRSLGARRWIGRAAAAILLVAGSATLTLLATRSRQAPSERIALAERRAAAVAASTVVRAVDDSYADVVEELSVTLREQRELLAPATVATVERTLRIIDEAIAEARAALAADPGNGALLDVLSANYEQKVQLLRRASEIPART